MMTRSLHLSYAHLPIIYSLILKNQVIKLTKVELCLVT